MKRTLIVLVAFAALCAEAACYRHLADGENQTIVIGYGAAGQNPGQSDGSKFACFYDLQNGGTLRYYDPNGGGRTSSLWNMIVATNGLAVIDLTAWPAPNVAPVFCGGIFTDGGKGRILVKGRDTIIVGSPNGNFAETGLTDIPDITFVKENGEPYGTGGLVLYTVNFAALPTNANVIVTFSSDNHRFRCCQGLNTLGNVWTRNKKPTRLLLSQDALAANETLHLPANITAVFSPGAMVYDENNGSSIKPYHFVDRIAAPAPFAFDAVLDDGARLVFSNSVAIAYTGTVTGTGSIEVAARRTGDILGGTVTAPVTGCAGSALTLADGASLATFEPADDTVRLLAGEGTASLAAVTGFCRVGGQGRDVSALSFGNVSTGITLLDEGTATLLFPDVEALPAGAVMTFSGGYRRIYFGGTGTTVDASGMLPLRNPYDAYDIAGTGTVFEKLPPAVALRASAGTAATVSPTLSSPISLSLAGGAFTVQNSREWKDHVDYWFDVSQTNTTRLVGEGAWEDCSPTNRYSVGQPYIERVVDWRSDAGEYKLWNTRGYKATFDYVNTVYPYLCEDTTLGLHYLNFGDKSAGAARRMPFASAGKTERTISAKLIMMVFGSQQGGGSALIGTSNGAFVRTSNDQSAGIFANGTHDVWVNGAKLADPTAGNTLDGKWQIITVDVAGEAVNGFGWVSAWNDGFAHGGQRYGEILIFTNDVTELVRCEAEAYLANKWQIADFSTAALEAARAASPVVVNASGTGTIHADATTVLALGGNFAGTVNLAGGTLRVKDAPMPFTEATIPAADRVGWYDPDCRASVQLLGDFENPSPTAPANGLRVLCDRSGIPPETGDTALLGLDHRVPRLMSYALGYGPERGWIDFDGYGDDGDNLRFVAYDASRSYASSSGFTLAPQQIGAAFMVLDSSRTWFSPLMSDVNGYSGDFRRRESTTVSIWSAGTAEKVRNGETRLNGRTVDPSKGYTGCPEVLAFKPTAAATASFVGDYLSGEQIVTEGVGMLLGEMLFYSSAPSVEDTQRIEGYLMRKWLGLMPDTCVDVTAATIAGTGTVLVPDMANVPKFDANFTGTVRAGAEEAASGVFDVTIDPAADTVTGALVAPGATVTLPAACTIRVRFTAPPAASADGTSRVWPVFACADCSQPVTWTLEFVGGAPRKAVFRQTANRIDVVRHYPGLSVNIR